jgi:probable rRNA maturation factor
MKKISDYNHKINIFNLIPDFKLSRKVIRDQIQKVIVHFNFKIDNINVVFLDNRKIRSINKVFLSHDLPTDVISFRLNEGNIIDGEIYIGVGIARQNSIIYGVKFYNEIKRLLIHGSLHLIGFNDKRKKERAEMTKWEDYFLN